MNDIPDGSAPDRDGPVASPRVPVSLTAFRYFAVVLLIALLVANGLAPYLKVKNEYSMTMFSNLDSDISNHCLIPSMDIHTWREYVIVEQLEIDANNLPMHAILLLHYLDELNHPAPLAQQIRAKINRTPAPTSRPVHADVLRYHFAKLHRAGIRFEATLHNVDSGEVVEVSSGELPASWRRYSVLMGYRAAYGSTEEIHTVVRAYNVAKRRRISLLEAFAVKDGDNSMDEE